MADVFDVAKYILEKQGTLTAMKLQKLVYYAQAWHLVWDEKPLFSEPIEAWANGPVVYELYKCHRGRFQLGPEDLNKGDSGALSVSERDSVDAVLKAYAELSAHQLSEMTHAEAPWRLARQAAHLSPGERGNAPIATEAMFEYYDGLTNASTAQ